MGRDNDAFRPDALSVTRRHCEHDPVPKRHHGLFHALCLIMSFGNLAPAFQEIAREKLIDKSQLHDLLFDPEMSAMPGGKRQFPVIVFGAIVKAEPRQDLMIPDRLV